MIARMPPARRRSPARPLFPLALAALALAGCSALGDHREKKIPQLGVIDPHQPKELEMVSMPPYVVEPPDEIELTIRPAVLDLTPTTYKVQPEGIIDLGLYGDVYVAGLTLPQIEAKLAQYLARADTRPRATAARQPLQVAARLVQETQSKFYYIIGTVQTPGRFPITGNDTVLGAIMASGLRTNSLPEKAYVVRPHPHGSAPTVLKIDWDGITRRGDTLTDYQLFPGDRIIVPGGRAPGLLGSLVGG